MTFIVKPLVTEKMTKLTDKSSVAKTYKVKGQERTKKAETKYGFIVLPEANKLCLLYTSPSPRDLSTSRMPSSA